MSKGSFNFFEMHLEKIVLGLGGVFLLFMVWTYLISSPNVVEYNGQALGPAEVDDKIVDAAKDLERAVRNQDPQKVETVRYDSQVEQVLGAGIFGAAPDGAPPLASTLRRSAPFGERVEYPGAQDGGGIAVAVVKPIAPERPLVSSGRSVVTPASFKVPPAPDPAAEPRALSWVSVAAYFPLDKQQQDMKAAGYSADKQRVYIAGVDVQRQELLASGEWSEWADVKDSKAAVQVEIPEVEIDSASGAVRNAVAVKDKLNLIRELQREIIQPEFHTVDKGDRWDMPTLPDMLRPPPKGANASTGTGMQGRGGAVAPPPTEGEGGMGGGRTPPPPAPPIGGGGIRPGQGRPGIGGLGPRGGGGGGVGQSSDIAEARRQADRDIKDAEAAFQRKEYDSALTLVEGVISNQQATDEQKSRSRTLKRKIEEERERQARSAPATQAATLAAGEIARRSSDGAYAMWFNDDTAVAGKTYRYRMRVQIWNRYVGQLRSVKELDDAKQATLPGEWSEPSDPISVMPTSYFFVRGPKGPTGTVANVEVWKWTDGAWTRETFDVAPGETIGGIKKDKSGSQDFTTDLVALDVRKEMVKTRKPGKDDSGFSFSPEIETIVVTYVDPIDGQIKERTAATYRTDPVRKKLVADSGGGES